jgi:hypothetical protein
VNLEVVRSRCSRDPKADDVLPFADRARLQVHAATVLTNGLLAIVAAAASGQSDPKGKTRKSGDGSELALNADLSAVFADVQQLAGAIGVSIEQRGLNVILKVLPEGNGHSKV